MPLFSASEPLAADFQEALSPAYTADNVGSRFFRTGVSKLASSQDGIRNVLTPNEKMLNIAPSVTGGMGYDGLLILTNLRALHYKGKLRTAIPIANVVDVELASHPAGYVLTTVVSATAREYEAFANSPTTDSGMKYWANVIQTCLTDPRLARHAAALIIGEANRAQS